MPSVAKAKFCRDAYLRNDTSPETIEKIKEVQQARKDLFSFEFFYAPKHI